MTLIFLQIIFVGRIGGDYISTIERANLAIENPNFFIFGEPFTVVFALLSQYINISTPKFYLLLTNIIFFYVLSRSKNKFIYLTAYSLFVVPISFGYFRQALSSSFLLLFLVSKDRVSASASALLSIMAHPTALLALVFYSSGQINKKIYFSFTKTPNRIVLPTLIIIILAAILTSETNLIKYIDSYVKNYSSVNMESGGFLYRFCLYSSLFLLLSFFSIHIKKINNFLIIHMIFFLILTFIFSLLIGSTAADRSLVYTIPFLMYCIMNEYENLLSLCISLICCIYFLSWLFFSHHASSNWKYQLFF
jgi:hypothetical protein